MARQILALALTFLAIVGLASAVAKAPTAASVLPPTSGGAANDSIGTTDGKGVGAAPVGAPVPSGAFGHAPAPAPNSDASILKVTSIGAVVPVVARLFL